MVDVLQGMNVVLEFLASPARIRNGMGWTEKKRLADKITLVVEGMKRYAKFQTGRMDAFACAVEELGVDVAPERVDAAVIKEKMAAEIEATARTTNALTNKSLLDKQILEMAEQLRDQTNALPERTASVLDIDRRLRDKAELMIMTSLDKNELVHKIAMAIVLPARDDPGPSQPV